MSFQNWHVKHPSFTRDDPHFDLVYRQNVKPGKYHRVRQNTSSSPSSSASCATSSSLVESADGPSPVKLERPDESTFFPIDLPLLPPPLRFDPVYLEGHLTPLGLLGSWSLLLLNLLCRTLQYGSHRVFQMDQTQRNSLVSLLVCYHTSTFKQKLTGTRCKQDCHGGPLLSSTSAFRPPRSTCSPTSRLISPSTAPGVWKDALRTRTG